VKQLHQRGFWPVLFLGLGATVVGCGTPEQPPPEAPPPEVKVSRPVRREVTDYEEFIGWTDAKRTVVVRARATGYLNTFHFKEGDYVKKGTLLFKIDPRQYRAELARARATLVQAQAHARRLQADYERALKLHDSSLSISQQEFDQIAGDRQEAVAAVGVAKANADLAELNLSYTEVPAPIDGRLSRTLIDPHNMVKADDTALTSIVSLDPIYVYFDVDEDTVLRIRRLIEAGQVKSAGHQEATVTMELKDGRQYPHTGTINFVDNRLDLGTGTLRLRARFPNAEQVLAPGLFARVKLPVGKPYQAVLVAEQAVGTDQGQKFLYVVNDKNMVERRRVDIGREHGSLRVITKGLKKNEKVVVSGLQRVRPDTEVRPILVRMPESPAPATQAPAAPNAPAASQGAAAKPQK